MMGVEWTVVVRGNGRTKARWNWEKGASAVRKPHSDSSQVRGIATLRAQAAPTWGFLTADPRALSPLSRGKVSTKVNTPAGRTSA